MVHAKCLYNNVWHLVSTQILIIICFNSYYAKYSLIWGKSPPHCYLYPHTTIAWELLLVWDRSLAFRPSLKRNQTSAKYRVTIPSNGEGNGTPSSTLAWKIPWAEEPGGLQSMGSLRVGHNWATSLSLFTYMHWRRKWQPTPVFLPGESQGWWSLVGCRLWGRTGSDTAAAAYHPNWDTFNDRECY